MKTPASAVGVLLLVVIAAGAAEGQLRTRPFVSGLSAPVAIVQDPTDPTVQFVVEQRGLIRVVKNGALLDTDFLDLRNAVAPNGGERGLFSIAFPPNALASGRFFVCFTNPEGNIVVARFKRSANPLVAGPGSRFDLVWPDREGGQHPFIPHPGASNHNGGDLVFGPGGFLYIGTGDGGGGNDTFLNGQNPMALLGKMLRIDVNVPDADPRGYVVPADNPFVSGVLVNTAGDTVPVLKEIWAFGLRNPWRYNFDDVARGGTGALVIADVGQNAWEEVDYEPPGRGGRNYGWPNFEANHSNVTARPLAYEPPTPPVFEYSHNGASASITGGYVYRGAALGPEFDGRYFFADFIRGHVWSIALVIDPTTGEAQATDLRDHTADLGGAGMLGNISSFGVDADGELFIVSYSGGSVLRIVPRGPPDLVVSAVAAPATGVSGRTISIPNTVRNIGDQLATGPFSVNIYMSANSSVPGAGVLLASRNVSALAAGAASPATTVVTVPPTAVVGQYFVSAVVDPDNVVTESDETNNGATAPTRLEVIRPDLAMVAVSSRLGDATGTRDCGPVRVPNGAQVVRGDTSGRGCLSVGVYEHQVLTIRLRPDDRGPRRFALGLPGDVLMLGAWDCGGLATPALYRPSTGQTLYFTTWRAGEQPVTVRPACR